MAVAMNWESFTGSYGAPSKRLGGDMRQVWS